MNSRKWIITTIIVTASMLLLVMSAVVYIDPWFHFHKPVDWISYKLDRGNQRYQNDGILSNIDYDCIIIGSSMVENTRVSQVDDLFDVKSVKVPYLHTSYKEAGMAIDKALNQHPDTRMVIWGLDYCNIIMDKDDMWYSSYPDYLYDDSLLNDVNYIFNMRAFGFLANDALMTLKGEESTSFDEYSSWDEKTAYGRDAIVSSYTLIDYSEEIHPFSVEDKSVVDGNIQQNIVDVVNSHKSTEFYLFITPYSIYYWDDLCRRGDIDRQLEAERYMIEKLLSCENVHLYSFFTEFDMICDPDNYYDYKHYRRDINSFMMDEMLLDEYLITWDNYEDYCDKEKAFYSTYDYKSLFD